MFFGRAGGGFQIFAFFGQIFLKKLEVLDFFQCNFA